MLKLYGMTQPRLFGPLALRAVRDDMVRQPVVRKVKVRDPETGLVREEEQVLRIGLARTTVNARVRRIRQLFRWGASMDLVPVAVFQALATVQGLQRGRTTAPEPKGIASVPVELVDKARPFMPPPVAALVQLQLLTGARLGELLKPSLPG
jgi:hypothetical protein